MFFSFEKIQTSKSSLNLCTGNNYLGSINTVYNQTSNTIIVDRNYDAWGRERDVSTLAYSTSATPEWLSRGFEGHEMLTDFALINMNGRVYDPVIGQFISADPVLQDENNCLNYNKYCFAFNNPLKYIDPSGCVTVPLGTTEYDGGVTFNESTNDIATTGSWLEVLKINLIRNDISPEDMTPEEYEEYCKKQGIPIGKTVVIEEEGVKKDKNKKDPNYTERVGFLDYVGYIVEGTGKAAANTAQEVYRYGRIENGVLKSFKQLTLENTAYFSKLATKVNIAGAVIGVVDCSLQSIDDFANEDYALGSFEASKALAFLGGLALCTNPATLAIGLSIIGGTGVIDIAGDAALYLYGKNK